MASLKDVGRYLDRRAAMRAIVEDFEKDEDEMLGKRTPTEFFPTDESFEPKRNKVVKTSSVLAAVNLIAANFMVRTWPKFLSVKIREYVESRIATAVAAKGASKLSLSVVAKGVAGFFGKVVGAFAKHGVEAVEMRGLEKSLREASAAVRKSLNAEALAQVVKPARIGKVSTRNGSVGGRAKAAAKLARKKALKRVRKRLAAARAKAEAAAEALRKAAKNPLGAAKKEAEKARKAAEKKAEAALAKAKAALKGVEEKAKADGSRVVDAAKSDIRDAAAAVTDVKAAGSRAGAAAMDAAKQGAKDVFGIH